MPLLISRGRHSGSRSRPDPEIIRYQSRSRIPNVPKSIPNPEFFKLNPESRNFQTQSRIPIPNPEIFKLNPESRSRIPNFPNSIPNPEICNFNPESRNLKFQSRIPKSEILIPIPNPEITNFNPESRSRIPKSQISIPNPDPEFRDWDLVGIVGISIPNADLC